MGNKNTVSALFSRSLLLGSTTIINCTSGPNSRRSLVLIEWITMMYSYIEMKN